MSKRSHSSRSNYEVSLPSIKIEIPSVSFSAGECLFLLCGRSYNAACTPRSARVPRADRVVPNNTIEIHSAEYPPMPTEEDARIIKASMQIIFSNYSPGYMSSNSLKRRSSYSSNSHNAPISYFYNAFRIVSELKNIEIDEKYSGIFIDMIEFIVESVGYIHDPNKWREIYLFYRLYTIEDDIFYLLGDVLFETLRFVLLEKHDSEVMRAWRQMYWNVLWRVRRKVEREHAEHIRDFNLHRTERYIM